MTKNSDGRWGLTKTSSDGRLGLTTTSVTILASLALFDILSMNECSSHAQKLSYTIPVATQKDKIEANGAWFRVGPAISKNTGPDAASYVGRPMYADSFSFTDSILWPIN